MKCAIPKKLLLLTLDCFSNDGGIQSVCKTLCYTLQSISQLPNQFDFEMKSLHDHSADIQYLETSRFTGFNGGLLNFIFDCLLNYRKYDIIIISHINLLSMVLYLKYLRKQTKVILIAHGTEMWRPLTPWKVWFLKKHVMIWAVSQHTKNKIVEIHQLYPQKIEVVHNCLSPFFKVPNTFIKNSQLLSRYGLSPNQKVILTVSRQTSHERAKGYQTVLTLLPQLLIHFPNLHYLICGKADEEELIRLSQIIEDLNLTKHVTLAGFIPEQELSLHYMLCDAFILTSSKEGFGLVLIEAAACGCNIISGNADGSLEALINGELGIAVDPDNSIMIKKAIHRTLNRKHSNDLSCQIQNLCLTNFSQKKYQQKIQSLLK